MNAGGRETHAATARKAGLTYVTDSEQGITRKRVGGGFAYYRPDGALIRDRAERKRINSLAIPPAWTDVWICPDPGGHMQVTARDAKGRKQYRYGLTTLRQRHAAVEGHTVRFEFKGKSGVPHSVTITDRRLAAIVQQLQDLPGQQLFQFIDEDGSGKA